MKFLKYFILILIFYITDKQTIAQNKDSLKNSYITANFSYGIIYAHHEDFKYFIKDYVSAFAVNWSFKSKKNKLWQKVYRYPATGIGFTRVYMGNPDVLGNASAIYTYINLPYFETKNLILYGKFAAGVAYLNKDFDLYHNKYNIAIGSHINAYLNINIEFRYKIFKRLYLLSGIGLNHFSNGGTTKPNKGINLFLPTMGLSYAMQKTEYKKHEISVPKFTKKNELSIIYAIGYSGIEAANPKKYFASSISLNAERQFSYKGKYGIGLDIFYDTSIPFYNNIKDTVINNSFSGKIYAGSHISYDFVFSKTSFTIQFGAYFYKGNNFEEYVYNRFGLKYRINNRWLANLSLKSFWAKAKFPEFGIGYRF